jgi:FO synthase
MEENISRAAGATHGQGLDAEGLRALADAEGRSAHQRTTLYERVPAAGPARAEAVASAQVSA